MTMERRIGLVFRGRALAGFLGILVAGCSSTPSVPPVAKAAASPGGDAIVEKVTVPTAQLHNAGDGQIREMQPVDPEEEKAWWTSFPPTGPEVEYRIGPGDVLSFRSFDDTTLSEQVVVRYDGHVSLPLVPDVNVANLTRQEAEAKLRELYSTEFIEPRLSLSVSQVGSKSYHVIGSVANPNEYPYLRPTTLLAAVNRAGGLRVNRRGGDSFVGGQGQLIKAYIIRTRDGYRDVMEFDLRGIDVPGPHASETPVWPGDIVYVPEGMNLVYLIGEVRRPDVYALTENMTLLQLLAMAGGAVERTGKLSQVVLMREVDAENTDVMLLDVRKMLSGKAPDVWLEPGDVIYVPQKLVTRVSGFVQQFTAQISPVLSLYNQMYETYYTDKRLRRLYESDSDLFATSGVGALADIVRTINSIFPTVTP